MWWPVCSLSAITLGHNYLNPTTIITVIDILIIAKTKATIATTNSTVLVTIAIATTLKLV